MKHDTLLQFETRLSFIISQIFFLLSPRLVKQIPGNSLNFDTCSYFQIFYLVGFGFFCLESLISLWVIQVQYNLPWYLVDFCVGHIVTELYSMPIWYAASVHVLQREWKSCRDEEGGCKVYYDVSIVTWLQLRGEGYIPVDTAEIWTFSNF